MKMLSLARFFLAYFHTMSSTTQLDMTDSEQFATFFLTSFH
jgi:hypothetical protein